MSPMIQFPFKLYIKLYNHTHYFKTLKILTLKNFVHLLLFHLIQWTIYPFQGDLILLLGKCRSKVKEIRCKISKNLNFYVK